jgi:outer membrane protein assembly factor BamB
LCQIYKTLIAVGLILVSLCGCQQTEAPRSLEKVSDERTPRVVATPEPEAPATAGNTDADWPLFRGNPEATGVATSTLPSELAEQWKFEVGKDGGFRGSPVIVRNQSDKKPTVYIADLDGKIYSLNLATGHKNWDFQAGISIEASPAYSQGKIFIGDVDGNFYCLNEAGELVWKRELGAEIVGAANFFGEGVLVGGQDAKLHFLNQNTGKTIWEFEADDQIQCSMTVADGRAFIAGCDGHFRIIDLETGKEVGSVEMGSPTASTPAVIDGKAVVGTEQAEFICVDLKEMSAAWGFVDKDGPVSIRGSAAVKGDRVIFGARNRQVYSVDLKTGELQWTITLKGSIDGSPVIVEGADAKDRVFIGAGDGRLYALSLNDGEILWQKQLNGAIDSSPGVAFGKLVIATDRGVVYCLGK